MKFSCAVDINVSTDKAVELMDNPDNFVHWQDGFISYEHISGPPGEVGSKMKYLYKMGNKELELIETIRVNNLPEEFTGLFESKPMTNTMTVRFIPLGESKTRYESDVHYTVINGFMVKLMSKLFPGMFKKQVQKWMNQFRDFCEATVAEENSETG